MFGVCKKWMEETQSWLLRLIFDRRPQNALESLLAAESRMAAHAACLIDLVLEPHQSLRIWTSDLPVFFYTLRVSQERVRSNAFGPALPAAQLTHLRAFKRHRGSGAERLQPCLASLAMGDVNASAFAQDAHQGLLRSAGVAAPDTCIVYGTPLPRSPLLHGIVIDDHAMLAILDHQGPYEEQVAHARQVWARAMEAYASEGLSPVPEKCTDEAQAARLWGAWLDGQEGSLGVHREKRAHLAGLTLSVAAVGWADAHLRRGLLGNWIMPLMFRRPLFSLLQESFRGLEEGAPPAPLTPRQRGELAMLSTLAPLAECNVRASVDPTLWATDASPIGAGVVSAAVPAACARELWRYRERRGFSTFLDSPEMRVLHERYGCPEFTPQDRLEPAQAHAAAWGGELAEALPYRTRMRYRFRKGAHINILECRARHTLVKHLARDPRHHSLRHLTLQDSRVVLGASAHGRSRSLGLNHELSKSAAFELGADLQVGGLWCDTSRMPADGPSRHQPHPPPPCASPAPWVRQFLAGDVAALGRRTGL